MIMLNHDLALMRRQPQVQPQATGPGFHSIVLHAERCFAVKFQVR